MKKLADQLNRIAQNLGVVPALSKLLADEYVLYAKLRNYHWNVIGVHFNDLHKFFETQYVSIEEIVDQVAERIRALSEHAPATLGEFLDLTQLKEPGPKTESPTAMLADLFHDYKLIAKSIKDVIPKIEPEDPITANFLAELGYKHQKTAWMLESLLTRSIG